MAERSRTIAIAGASLAGGTAAATLREDGFDGRVVLIGTEELRPYERPPLSKEFLRGEGDLEHAFLRPGDWYEEHDIELRLGETVERLDGDRRELVLESGERIGFDSALLATGARNRRLDAAGVDLPGVHDLRTPADSMAIRSAARAGGRAVVVGMGFIGSEVAASLRRLGAEVTVVELFETTLYRVLGAEVGRVFEGIHRDNGVRMHFEDSVESFEGSDRLEAVVTTTGKRIECDFAVVGVGVQPNVEPFEGSGVEVANGVVVDAKLETSLPGVFAAGDLAAHDHPTFGRIRVEHFDNALKMGQAAARNMLDAGEPFDDPHWFWSDQYDVNLQMSGFASSWDRIVFRGSVEERRFAGFYLSDGVLRSVVSVNWPRDVRRAMPLIASQARPDPAALADPEVDLRKLAAPAAKG